MLQLAGVASGLTEAAARAFTAGHRLPDAPDAPLKVVDARPPGPDMKRVHISADSAATILVPSPGSWQVSATLLGSCTFVVASQRCTINGVPMVGGAVLPLPDGAQFLVDEVRADAPAATLDVVVRFVGLPDAIAEVKPGDVDVAAPDRARAARITSVRGRQTVAAQVSTRVPQPRQAIEVTTQIAERVDALDTVVRLTADVTDSGYVYRFDPIKAGAVLIFESARYVVRGTIMRVSIAPDKAP
jgi:hypothetical protein